MSIWNGIQKIASRRCEERQKTIELIRKGGPDFYWGMFKFFCWWMSILIFGFGINWLIDYSK